jgi:predicted DNA-binding transcriptional regulator AlpA
MSEKRGESSRDLQDDRLLSRQEVAELTSLSYFTLAAWASTKQGPEFIKVGRRALYRRSSVERWLAETGRSWRRKN